MAGVLGAPPGALIPMPDNRHLLELGYEAKTDYDYGHIPTAWYNLGLHNQPAVPGQAAFERYCRDLIAAVHVVNGRARSRASQVRRFRLLVMAIRTISGQARRDMLPSRPHDDFPGANDLPSGMTWAAVAAAAAPLPLPAAQVRQIRSRTAAQALVRHRRKLAYRQAGPDAGGRLSVREVATTARRIRMNEWEHANRHSAFHALNGHGIQTLMVVTTYKEDDNSLWHALSYQINGPGVSRHDGPRLGLRGGRREKAWLYHYFTSVLHDPTHMRHRLYTWMQEQSRSVLAPGHNAQTTAQMRDWGELSMLRTLAVNDQHGGVPKWPQFAGIFQLMADFWRKEVVVFLGPVGMLPLYLAMPFSGWRQFYTTWVFGKREYGLGARANPEGRGQLLFVTDGDTMQHFDAVECPPGGGYDDDDDDDGDDGAPSAPFDTLHLDENGRYGHLQIPFLDIPGRVPPTSRAPSHIPDTDNGLPFGHPGRVVYERPADDPRYRLPDHDPLVACYEADRDVVETRPGFGGGRMPRLANMQTMGAWTAERGAPGVDARPTVFEPWLVTSGCHRLMRDPGPIRQGHFENKIAAQYYECKVKLEGSVARRAFTIRDSP